MKGRIGWLLTILACIAAISHEAAAAPAIPGDVVFRKNYRVGRAAKTKLTVTSSLGTSKGSVVLPQLPNKMDYRGFSVAGRFAFLTGAPTPASVEGTIALKLCVVDLAQQVPKVVALLDVPMSPLLAQTSTDPSERCGLTDFDYLLRGNVAARRISGGTSGRGLYRIAFEVACFADFSFDGRVFKSTTRTVVQTLTYDPSTKKLGATPLQPLYNLGSSELIDGDSVFFGVIPESIGFLSGSLFMVGVESRDLEEVYTVRGFYKLQAAKPALVFSLGTGRYISSDRTKSFVCSNYLVASPTSAYASCIRFSDNAQSVVEISSSGSRRTLGKPFLSSTLQFRRLGTNAKPSTPVYVSVVDRKTAASKVFAASKSSGNSRLVFSARYPLGTAGVGVVE